MPLPHGDLQRLQNQMIARYTLSASGAPRTCVKSLRHNNFR
jgi:hypothetical protein